MSWSRRWLPDADSPLTRAADAIYVDTTSLDANGVLKRMLEVVEERRAR